MAEFGEFLIGFFLGIIAPRCGLWALPSGGVEADEEVVSTVRRELFEELVLIWGTDAQLTD